MGELAPGDRSDERLCYRCKCPITGTHWFTLSADYGGEGGEQFQNTERYICVDCLAGIGMLEFEEWSTKEVKEKPSLRDRLSLR